MIDTNTKAMLTSSKVGFMFYVLMAAIMFTACDKTRVMDENSQIDGYKWDYKDAKAFTTEIKDTSLNYNLYINVRHSFQFEWRNMWVNIKTKFPDGKEFNKRVNLVLSEPDGHWFGDCTGDNCYLQIPIQLNAWFPQPGQYTFTLTQDMRVNPIGFVKSIGMRIETADKAKK